jgi:hypothetical protein
MSTYDDDDGPAATTPRRKLEAAMQEVAEYRREYIRASVSGVGGDQSLLRGFHAAVICYYCELRPYREEGEIEDIWDEVVLWETADSERVQGLETLERWINATETHQVDQPGRGAATRPEQQPACLDGDRLLRVSYVLDEVGKALDLAVPVPESTHRTEIDDELMEEVEEWRQKKLS